VVRFRPTAAFVTAVAAFAFMFAVWHANPTGFDNYVYLADAWTHGRNWIDFPGDFIDAIPFHGRAYIVEAPMPAILLFPAVLAFGTHANQTLLSNVLGAVAVFAAWRVCQNAGLRRVPTIAATAFLFFGTSLFVCATVGDVWFVSHTAAAAFTLLTLAECFGRRRAWLVAIWAVAAAFSRYPLLAVLPIYLCLLLARDLRKVTLERFLTPLVPALIAWMLYNYSRWQTLFDPAFSLFYRIMDTRHLAAPDAFSLDNVPMQTRAFFLSPPILIPAPPWIVPPYFGFSISFTSAPFLYALFAGASIDALALWLAALATALPAFAYFDIGGAQYGMRHALDFEPFLFALLVLALKRRPSSVAVAALGIFAAFGAYEGLVWLLAPSLTH
jgi:hypothetical protein